MSVQPVDTAPPGYAGDMTMQQAAPPGYGQPQYGQPQYQQPQPYGQQPQYAQPQSSQQNTVVVVQQPQQMTVKKQRRAWSSGMCGCFDDICSCCAVMWCLPIFECWLSSKMDEGCCMPWCVPYSTAALRTRIRAENKIAGSICGDCCATYYCTPCVLCQIKREWDVVEHDD